MKIKQLLNKLTGILNDERLAKKKKYKSLKKVLKSLRNEKKELEKKLANTQDANQRHDIKSHLKIINAQRKKGLKVLKGLKQ